MIKVYIFLFSLLLIFSTSFGFDQKAASVKTTNLNDYFKGQLIKAKVHTENEQVLSSPPPSADSAYVSIAITSGSNPSCIGSYITFTATPVNGGTAPSYQWKLNGVNIGTNSAIFSSNVLSTGHVITCEMISNEPGIVNNPALSNSIMLVVSSPELPTITISTASTAICPGTTATFNALVTHGGSTPSFQWKKNGVNVGGNSPVYSSSSLLTGDSIWCVLTSSSTCVTTNIVNSNGITISVANSNFPTPTVTITASSAILCNIPSVTFTATPTNEGYNPAYQWKVNGVNAGTNSNLFTSTSLLPNDVVSCVMTAVGSCATVSSLSNTTAYNSSFSQIAFFPTSFGNGRQQYLIRASELTAIGISAGYLESIGVNLASTAGSPSTLNGFTIKLASTVSTSLSSGFQNPAFTTCFGPINFSPVTGTDNILPFSTPFYWNGTSNVIVDLCFSNQSTGSINFISKIYNTSFISCIYYQANGVGGAGACTASIGGTGAARPNMIIAGSTLSNFTSNSITMTGGGNLVPSVTITPSAPSICPGNLLTFTASITHGGSNPVYQWKRNGVNVGTNSNTYSNSLLSNGDTVSCAIVSNLICATPVTANSNEVVVVVIPTLYPTVSIQAVANNICVGQSMTFNATPVNAGSSPSFQWKLNNANVGSNSSTFTLTTPVMGDVVKCVITSSHPCPSGLVVNSNQVTCVVNPYVTPTITISPSVNNVCPGTTINITSTVVNGGTYSNQWKINGNVIVGSFSNYISSSFANGDVITNTITSLYPCCLPSNQATSNAVTLNILNSLPPVVTISPSSNPVCTGAGATFVATAINPGINANYQWKLNGNNVGTNSLLYMSTPLTNNDQVTCEYTSTVACPIIKNIGLGTTNSITNFGAFFPTAYGNGRQQYLIRASELLANGMVPGNIHSIGVQVSASPVGNPNTLNDYTIKLAHTSATALNTTFQTPTWLTVYGPTNYTPVLNTKNTMTFTTPFSWDGVSNVLVDICFANNSTGSVAYRNTVSSYTYANTTVYQVNGTTSGICSQATGNASTTRPNFTFTSIPIHTVNSNTLLISVSNPVLPSVDIDVVQGGNPTCDGAHVGFHATPTYGGASPSFQWKVNGIPSGTNSAYFYSTTLQQGDVISCSMTSNYFCVSSSTVESDSIIMSMSPCSCLLDVKVLLQGYYSGNGNLYPVLYNQGVETNPGSLNTDTVRLELHDAIPPYTLKETFEGLLHTDGFIHCIFPGSVIGNSYYLVARHRNSVATWSSTPITFNMLTTYDFSTASAKAFGSNMSEVDTGIWAVYYGDINQDGSVDAFDYLLLDPDVIAGLSGYLVTDLNGDGIVDAFDYILLDINLTLGITTLSP